MTLDTSCLALCRASTSSHCCVHLSGLSEVDVLGFNEGRTCDAIIRHLEERAKAPRSNVTVRDHDPDPARRVELTFNISDRLYALEHTGIEPFADFVRNNNEAPRLTDPIKTALANTLPLDSVIEMSMPIFALSGRPKKELAQIQANIAQYVIATAPTLQKRRYSDYIGDIGPVTPPGVPFAVRLYRFDATGFPPRFQIINTVSGDTKEMRRERIKAACDKKFPKLALLKAAEGARTILILEDNDFQLTNQSLVAGAYVPIARQRDDAPDETYMVMTCATDTWYVWPILIDNISYFDLSPRYHPIHLEFDPAALTSVTER